MNAAELIAVFLSAKSGLRPVAFDDFVRPAAFRQFGIDVVWFTKVMNDNTIADVGTFNELDDGKHRLRCLKITHIDVRSIGVAPMLAQDVPGGGHAADSCLARRLAIAATDSLR